MGNENGTTYILKDKSGAPVLNREGRPFVYSALWLARLGKSVLEAKLETKLKVEKRA